MSRLRRVAHRGGIIAAILVIATTAVDRR